MSNRRYITKPPKHWDYIIRTLKGHCSQCPHNFCMLWKKIDNNLVNYAVMADCDKYTFQKRNFTEKIEHVLKLQDYNTYLIFLTKKQFVKQYFDFILTGVLDE